MAALKTFIFGGQSNIEGGANLTHTAYADPYPVAGGTVAPHLDVPTSNPPALGEGTFPGIWCWANDWLTSVSAGAIKAYTLRATTYAAPYNRNLSITTPYTPPLSDGLFNGQCNYLWHMANFLGEDVLIVKLAVAATTLARYEADIGIASVGWFDPSLHNSWSPSYSDRLFHILFNEFLPAAKAAVVGGAVTGYDSIDVQHIVFGVGESDSLDTVRSAQSYENAKALTYKARERVFAQGCTTLNQFKIPVTWMGIRESSGVWPYASTFNDGLRKLATNDLWVGFVSTEDYSLGGVNGFDQLHYDAQGQVDMHKAFFDNWKLLRYRAQSTLSPDAEDRVTLSEIRDEVKLRFEKNKVTNVATNARIDQFINDAVKYLVMRFRSSAWWMRRIERLSLTATPDQAVALPKPIKRIARIEAADRPGEPVDFNQVGFTDGGQPLIILRERFSGTFDVHHMVVPKKLTEDDELLYIPEEISELIVVSACRRLAQGSGWTALEASFRADERDLLRQAHGLANATDRARNEVMGRRSKRNRVHFWRELDVQGY